MTVWITRTRPGANRTAARLKALGLDSLVDPVLEVRPVAADLDLAGYDALAFTNGNGVAAFAALSDDRALPAWAVGSATAEALREIGFERVVSADGDVEALARILVAARPGRVLCPGPRQPAGDLPGLAARGSVRVEALALYETLPLTPERALSAAGLSAVLIQSARAAEVVADRVSCILADLPVFALSAQAAAPLMEAVQDRLFIAPFPDEPSLLKLCADTLSDKPS